MWKVLEQQHNLSSFVLVANNDALEFFRRGETWYTRKSRLEDVLDELEGKVILAREKVDEQTTQDLLECGIGLSEDQLLLQWPHLHGNIEGTDQLIPVE